MSVLVQLNDYKKSEGQIKYVVVHNELSPFIHEVKMASPPFWGSTLFVSIPFGIANAKKKCAKILLGKKLNAFFGPAPGFETAAL